MSPTQQSELDRLRDDLAQTNGPEYWKRLETFADSPDFRSFVETEYPSQLTRITDPVARRDFLRMMGASLAVAGLGACTRQPDEKILPYARTPESTIPGKPRFFATAMPLDGAAIGLLVESHMGRPTKVEGNPDHPASLGATDAFAQAATLGLYDPDRSHSVLAAGQISTWDAFLAEFRQRLSRLEPDAGEGIRLLMADHSSPSLDAQLARLREALPKARIHSWTPLHQDNASEGSELAFGERVAVRHQLDQAAILVSIDADFLASGSDGVRNARGYADGRKVHANTASMSRFYAIESGSTLTGSNADERLTAKPSEIEGVARALAQALGIQVEASPLDAERAAFVRSLANQLLSAKGQSLIVAGEGQSANVHALTHTMNERLGNVGRTVDYAEPRDAFLTGNQGSSFKSLVDDIHDGKVKMLIVVGGNPVYDAPADFAFGDTFLQVPFRIHLSLYEDETSELCHWHLPETHFLESWSDARAHDGTASIVQPLIAPLYDGRSAHDLIAVLTGETGKSSYDLVRDYWRKAQGSLDDTAFEIFWDTSLHDGVIARTASPPYTPNLRRVDFGPAPTMRTGLEIVFRRDRSVHDGRFANNGWLQELPRPLSLLTWDNAAIVSEKTAASLGAADGDVVEFTTDGRSVQAPVWILPGHADEVVTMHLGYGRRRAGHVGSNRGFDAYSIRTSENPWWVDLIETAGTSERIEFACVQDHARMEGRDIVRVAEFDRFKRDPHHAFPSHGDHDPADLSMYPDHQYPGYSWGMVIDLTACIGCNGCMVACQSENNVPIVGKEEVAKGRELHWLRVDRYFEKNDKGKEQVHYQPIPCMHCENAPCEVVCPVGATVHGDEGLNEMVYNRCVGTRYCSNNCPYKVRRFNFFHYADYETESLKLGNNPDVTVRSRGVMEKCTYCVQRINEKRITSKNEDRQIQDGEIKTACQQACPTQAIAFGNINDAESEVSSLRHEPQHYALLGELGTRPRTTYLAKLTNPEEESAG